MKVFSPPASRPAPDFHPITTYNERCDAWLEELRAWVKTQSKHRLAGRVIRIPYADSYAQYMVLDGRRLLWLPLGDAWNVPDYMTRGLRVADLERMAV